MALVQAHGLTKIFRRPQKDPGLRGAFKHLVQRRFTDYRAVDGIDLSIEAGEAVAVYCIWLARTVFRRGLLRYDSAGR